MISDLDIYRAANLLFKQHGVDAELVAARRVGQMIERGDFEFEGVRMWQRITRAGSGDGQAALENPENPIRPRHVQTGFCGR